MKNSIQLNIGTQTNDGGEITIPEVATSLRRQGLVIVAARIVTGQWEGKEEQTLTCECIPALPICHAGCRLAIASAIGKLARELRQTCIALAWPDGSGELCPPQSGMDFNPAWFHPASEAASVPACDCVTSVVDALKHRSQVLRDNGKIREATECYCAGTYLTAYADDLRATICPAPARTPERKFFESVARDLESLRSHAEEIGNTQACITQELDSILAFIRPLAIAPRTPEITSGW